MNESRSMGATARSASSRGCGRARWRTTSRSRKRRARCTSPTWQPDGTPKDQFFTEPTGVFNTAELLINQLGLTPGVSHGDGPGLQILLNHYVEDVQDHGGHCELVTRNTLTGQARTFRAATVVLAAGSIESPKLLRRSSMYPAGCRTRRRTWSGRGLTDHPTSNEITTFVTGHRQRPDPEDRARQDHLLFARPARRHDEIRYPFNVEMNINHEYWHLRENDPNANRSGGILDQHPAAARRASTSSSASATASTTATRSSPPRRSATCPEIAFRNLSWMDHLAGSRFPALAGWQKNPSRSSPCMNHVTHQIFSQFQINGQPGPPENEVWYGQGGKGFGWGTVHHAAGTLRMPYRPSDDSPFDRASVVDEDLRVAGTQNLYVCDMSVMPFSSAANPVRTLVALALRLSRRLQ